MPDVIFLTTAEASSAMSASVFVKLGITVQQAVSDTLNLGGPEAVAVYEVVAKRVLNANPIQVLCLASKTEERLAMLDELRNRIGEAIQGLSSDPECFAYFEMTGTIDSWPIMPDGSWKEFKLV